MSQHHTRLNRRWLSVLRPATGTGVTVAPIQPFVFAPSIAPRLGIDMPSVGSGSYAEMTISTALPASPKAKGADADDTAGALTPITANPRRISARMSVTVEDVAQIGQANFESALRQNVSMALSDEYDDPSCRRLSPWRRWRTTTRETAGSRSVATTRPATTLRRCWRSRPARWHACLPGRAASTTASCSPAGHLPAPSEARRAARRLRRLEGRRSLRHRALGDPRGSVRHHLVTQSRIRTRWPDPVTIW